MGWIIAALSVAQLADLVLTVAAVDRYGPTVEVNPLVAGALSLGVLGIVAWKAALLAVVLAGAALNARWRSLLLAGALISGLVGATSGVVALA
ncbi:MAG: DUF5658 family protein [Gemmatimonadota bacterium]|jgi:hypothetical protein|nr:DUF5658 family protein [Gemmatimonadota bacterium]MDH5244391.1 DUF5658 family protein [Chloroflexota bacterium]